MGKWIGPRENKPSGVWMQHPMGLLYALIVAKKVIRQPAARHPKKDYKQHLLFSSNRAGSLVAIKGDCKAVAMVVVAGEH